MKRLLNLTVLAWLLSAQVASADITTGLVGWWKLDEGTGTSAADSSGNGNTGTLTNGPTWAAGKIGSAAVDVDGVNQFVGVGSGASLDNLSAMTVSAWLKPDSVAAVADDIIAKRGASGGWNLSTSSSGTGRLLWFVDYTTTDLIHRSVSDVVTVSVWNHVVWTWDGSTAQANAKIYVNGTEVTYASGQDGVGTRVDDAANSVSIGARGDATSPWDGQIDDVRVYNRVLSTADITELFAWREDNSARRRLAQ